MTLRGTKAEEGRDGKVKTTTPPLPEAEGGGEGDPWRLRTWVTAGSSSAFGRGELFGGPDLDGEDKLERGTSAGNRGPSSAWLLCSNAAEDPIELTNPL